MGRLSALLKKCLAPMGQVFAEPGRCTLGVLLECLVSRSVWAVLLAVTSILLVSPAYSAAQPTGRGIAVLASSIGNDYTPESLAGFIEQGKFSCVVVDWAWITYHWERTSIPAVNRFLELMAERKISVAAMYRPRFIANPTVPTQLGQDGQRTVDHAEICYSDPSARRWGIALGESILEKCPGFREVIVYNPVNHCYCPKCNDTSSGTSYAPVLSFLSEARSAWRAKYPGVKLGLVYMPIVDFWQSSLSVIDVAHPFLRIRDDVDVAQEITDIQAVRSVVKEKMGSSLGKVTWEEGQKVSEDKLKMVDALAGKADISYFLWEFDTLFASPLYNSRAVSQTLGMNPDTVAAALVKMNIRVNPSANQPSPASSGQASDAPNSAPPGEQTYTEEQIRSMPAETLIGHIANPEPGYHEFSAMWALSAKAQESTPEVRSSIISMIGKVIIDKQKPFQQRWQSCYTLADIGDEQAVSILISVIKSGDESLNSFIAESLATLFKKTNSTAAHSALRHLASLDQKAQEVLSRRLGETAVGEKQAAIQTTSVLVEELAPSGAPTPPPAPKRPVNRPLPWPFPGGYAEQNIFNNYQQATDSYIHSGLDFIHPAGTPVTAVGDGYVAAIYTNYPEWVTHHFFIVTPVRGGDRGWCYTHLDPRTFTFRVGDSIHKGQKLGSLVDFSLGKQPGVSHLHLHYVSFNTDAAGKVNVHSIIDPLYFFDWKDTEPPTFQPLRFVSDGTLRQFQVDAAGTAIVNGRVDVLAAIADGAFRDHMGNLGVPVVMLSISDGMHTMQRLVLDHRGDIGDETQTKPLYLSFDERKVFFNPDSFPRYQMLRVTKTDGDGKITGRDAAQCWDTTALDANGDPLWPNGVYSVNVYAWDIAGNQGVVGAKVRVAN